MSSPETSRGRESKVWGRVVFVIGVACALLVVSQGPQPCDDAYITFRHAKNLALELRPAWNLEGPRVLGSTSPAFLVALAVPASLIGTEHMAWVALYLNSLLLFAIVFLSYRVALDLCERPGPAVLAASLVGLNSVNVFVLSLGFEAGLLLFVLLAGLYAVRRKHYLVAVWLAALAPFVRPEGMILVLLVWAQIVLTGAFRPRLLAAFAVLPLVWVAFASSYYGSLLPQPLLTKLKFSAIHRPYEEAPLDLVGRLAELPSLTAETWFDRAEPILSSGSVRARADSPRRQAIRWLAVGGLLPLLVRLIRRRDDRIIYLLYPPMVLVLYAWLGHVQFWYYPSFVSLSILVLFSGCAVTVYSLAERFGISRVVAAGTCISVFALLLSLNAYSTKADTSSGFAGRPRAIDPRGEKWRGIEAQRYTHYRAVAEFLNGRDRHSRHHSVLTSEVGVFGYYYAGRVIDAVGLNSPEVLKFYPPSHAEIYNEQGRFRTSGQNFTPIALVMALEPDYLVNSLAFSANLLRSDSPFRKAYSVIKRFPRVWGMPIVVFERSRNP